MQVINGLSGRGVRVEDEPEARICEAELAGESRRGLDELTDERVVFAADLECAADVLARDQLHVRRRLRVDVFEGDDPLVLEHDPRRKLARGDPTEQAVTIHRALAGVRTSILAGMRSTEMPERLLLGPGPCNVSDEVREALAQPLVGHLDPAFLALLDEVQAMLASVFRAPEGSLVLPISGTGSAGMEACLVNLLEPGDGLLVAVNGVFGERLAAIGERCGARVSRVDAEMGAIVPPERLVAEIEAQRPDVVALVHAETSTGVAQPVVEAARAARASGSLVVLDCVTSLSGMDVRMDDWQIDAAYSGTQKCLACPPGLSPLAFGPRAIQRLARRQRPVQSWYLDLSLIGRYFGEKRVYHHTAPISMIYALHEALTRVLSEGLEARFARHRAAHEQLVAGLEAMGFRMLVPTQHRLPMLNTVCPPVAEEAKLRRRLLDQHGIEIGGGLGKLAGEVWRIGLMGENARPEIVDRLLLALRALL